MPLADLTANRPWTFVGGKGGVGKTTAAAALAIELAGAGEPTLVVSVDPAHSLGDALDLTLESDPSEVPGVPRLRAMEVDAEAERVRFLGRWRSALAAIIEGGTYLDAEDVDRLLDLAIPGVDEIAAMLRLTDLPVEAGTRVVVDTAPTGHALRLLDMPETAAGWLRPLGAMHAKRAAVEAAFSRAEPAGDPLLREIEERRRALADLMVDDRRCAFLLVTNPEPVVQAETVRYVDELSRRGVRVGGLLVNRATAATRLRGDGALDVRFAPRLPRDPVGADALRRFSAAVVDAPDRLAAPGAEGRKLPSGDAAADSGSRYRPPADRSVYLVAGKGGVGKSTVAAALAVWLAGEGRPTLLLGIDPAGSLHDLFDLAGEGAGVERSVPGVPRLSVRQLDAGAAWTGFRDRFEEGVEQLLEGVLGGLDASADRRVLQELVSLAPPGVDELAALLEMLELMESDERAVVLDTPPTGHLLRFLEMPEVTRDWMHATLRLLLKYRAVTGLGDLAEEILKMVRRIDRLRQVLRDPSRTALFLIALPEALSVQETGRLHERLGQLGHAPTALVVNRVDRPAGDGGRIPALAEAVAGTAVVAAPDVPGGLRGAEPLRSFVERWRSV